jgi:RNA polymerase sigma-70 factor (ECF subfamily)
MYPANKEKKVLEKLSEGCEIAFRDIFETYWELLHNIVYNRLQSADVADDLVQNVFTDLWSNRGSLVIETSLKAYLCQCIRHKIYNHIRHQEVRQRTEYVEIIYKQYYSHQADYNTDKQLVCNELEELVRYAIQKLPKKSRSIYQLSRNKNYTNQEIANHFGCTKKNVEYHISKSLSSIRLHIQRYNA